MLLSISDIYKKYTIPPDLQLHMLRTAAIAQTISESFSGVYAHHIVSAMLLHDMGNIIKFDLTKLPELLEPEGVNYWRGVQESFIDRYGTNEHRATEAIALEIGVQKEVYELIEGWSGFPNLKEITHSPHVALWICAYSDLRVAPYGIVSLEARLAEGRARYATHPKAFSLEQWDFLAREAYALEEKLFKGITLRPEDISEEALTEKIKALFDFQIEVQ